PCRGSVASGAKTSGASHDCRYDRKFKFALVEFSFHTFSLLFKDAVFCKT
ncbi:MAG: hypothetical protein ACI9VI_001037, partial [Candidatus Azotimanducaceae bacterium]